MNRIRKSLTALKLQYYEHGYHTFPADVMSKISIHKPRI